MFSAHKKRLREATTLRMTQQLNNADLTTIFYFLGILMSVAALIEGGQLVMASGKVSELIPSTGVLALRDAYGVTWHTGSVVRRIAALA